MEEDTEREDKNIILGRWGLLLWEPRQRRGEELLTGAGAGGGAVQGVGSGPTKPSHWVRVECSWLAELPGQGAEAGPGCAGTKPWREEHKRKVRKAGVVRDSGGQGSGASEGPEC